MPTYDSECTHCGKKWEYITLIENRNITPLCCGFPTKRTFVKAPLSKMDDPAFMKRYRHLYERKDGGKTREF